MRAIDLFDYGLSREPDHVCLIDNHCKFSHSEVSVFTHKLANALRNGGLIRGSRVGFYSSNCALTFIAMLAVFRAGCVWLPVHPRNSINENLEFLIENSCEFLFYHSSTSIDAAEFKKNIPTLKGFNCVDALAEDAPNLESMANGYSDYFSSDDLGEDDIAWIKSTGGTTGRSKSVLISNRSLVTLISAFHWCMPLPDGHVTLAATPLTHAAGNVSLCSVANGGTIVFINKADPALIIDAIERYRISTMFLPPTVIYNMLALPEIRRCDFSSLRYFIYCAAPMSVDKMREAIDVFGPVMSQGWGLAEAPLLCTFMGPDDYAKAKDKPQLLASCGRESPFAHVEIVDELGTPMPDGEIGELIVKSNLVMNGYFNRQEENEKALRNGALYTGDVGYRDSDGFYYIVDRNKDLIISGGFNIYPSEIEQVLWSHPAVLDCAVIGVPDSNWGEAVKAIVQLKPNHIVTDEELRNFCRKSLAVFKAPKTVEIWDDLPRSMLGKVLKREIRDKFWQGEARRI